MSDIEFNYSCLCDLFLRNFTSHSMEKAMAAIAINGINSGSQLAAGAPPNIIGFIFCVSC